MFKHRIVRELLETLYAIMITFSIGRWAIHIAYLERGYESIGGEYCFILMAYCFAWKIIHYFFDVLEDLKNE